MIDWVRSLAGKGIKPGKPDINFESGSLMDWKCWHCGQDNPSMWPGTYKTNCANCGNYWLDVAVNAEEDSERDITD